MVDFLEGFYSKKLYIDLHVIFTSEFPGIMVNWYIKKY